VGATTREGLLTPPLRARFQIRERLEFYPPADLERIVLNSAATLGLRIRPEAARLLASSARGTPRVVNRYLRRVRDVAQAWRSEEITEKIAREGLRRLGVDEQGLCRMDRMILDALARNDGRPLGLKTIAVMVGEQEDTIEDVYEPYLLRLGLITKSARGRSLTEQGRTRLGLERPGGRAQGGGLF